MVFERSACVKCHTTVDRDTPLAPSLRGVARGQKPEYLVESVLYPSKVIKTGFETERVTTRTGKGTHRPGQGRRQGAALVLNLDSEVRVRKADVESRAVQKVSLMPEGQEKLLSRQEFLDLTVYLASLRATDFIPQKRPLCLTRLQFGEPRPGFVLSLLEVGPERCL